MYFPTRIIAAGTLAIWCASAAMTQDVSADTVVATVNGNDITIGHMIVLRNSLPEQYKNLDDKVLFDGILDQLVQQSVLADLNKSPTRAVELQMENERRSLLAGAAIGNMLEDAVTDEDVNTAYQNQFANVEPAREFNASHILVATEEEAMALIVELEDGADFAELAKEHSTGPSGANGGQLGWFGAGMMVPPFEQAVVGMKVGDISAPVQTQFGWHVIILNETRDQSAPALDEVRADLVEELRQSALATIIEDSTAAANVVRPDLSAIDPAVLRDLGLVQN